MIRPSRGAILILGLVLAVATSTGCGKKGPVVAPERRLPSPPMDMRASVEERSIVVRWVVPRNRVDGTRLRDVAVMRLFRRDETPDGPPKTAMLSGGKVVGYQEIARIVAGRTSSPGAQLEGGTATFTDDKGLAFGQRYAYVATAEDSDERSSAPSPPLAVLFLAAPSAPGGLAAQAGSKEATLTWDAPPTLIDGSPSAGEVRYIVLRAVGDGALAAVTAAPITATTFTDRGLVNETTYRYAVRGVRVDPAGTATGPASASVTVTPEDTTPPSAPTRLIAIPGPGNVRLAWNASPEEDVARYVIYRAEGSGPFIPIATTPAITTLYTDRDVQSGRSYRYVVTAQDRARRPNESPRSNEAVVTVP